MRGAAALRPAYGPRLGGRCVALVAGTLLLLPAPALAAPVRAAAARAASTSPDTASIPKAVIIVGPVEGLTATYRTDGERWAQRAEAQGMDVRRVFSPGATWSAVLDAIAGAKLVVYLGHGNGWPSPYGPFQEDTKDGFGLNASAGNGDSNVKYYGANFIRASVHLAPDSIVVLGHACYSPGTGEPWQSPPTESVARQRVDNFAAGFLAAGARTTFAYYYEQTRDMVADLTTTDQTMDALFMQRGAHDYDGYDGTYAPSFDSVRTPGARIHMDRSTSKGWLRAVAGDLTMTTATWRGAPPEPDAVAPELSRFAPLPSATTYASPGADGTAASAPVVFTPNGDGVSDTVSIATTVSEGSYVDVVVRDPASGDRVRAFTTWSTAGDGRVTWDGRADTGAVVPDGRYGLVATPRDRAGNRGTPVSAEVLALTALRSPTATPRLFFARDGDALARTATLAITVARTAAVSWRIQDTAGRVVARKLTGADTAAGTIRWAWDGRTLDGSWARDGVFYSVVTATTDAGTYSHRFAVTHSAFKLYSATRSASGGTTVKFTITTAEPLSAAPSLRVTQAGGVSWVTTSRAVTATTYSVSITFVSGHAGRAALVVTGVDSGGQTQWSTFSFAVL